ncbi:MAG TPA: hypothetical protein VM842_07065 [Nitrospira sp.]|jgi:hypothetical protein|nr:hypothetical protein [Nitrospira sp.]
MPYHSRGAIVTVIWLSLAITLSGGPGASEESPAVAQPTLADRLPSFSEVTRDAATQLASVSGPENSLTLFKTVIGPRVGLHDAALAVGAKTLSPAMAKDLFMADLTRSAGEFMRGLAAWQLIEAVHSLNTASTTEQVGGIQRQIQNQIAWMSDGTGLESSLRQILALSQTIRSSEIPSGSTPEPLPHTSVMTQLTEAAAQVERWAILTAHREWFRLFNWKDQIRQQRGLARLCGTWQWSIHNHQNHREDKTSVIFSSPGTGSAVGPAEMIVVGDTVYLRWETPVGMQEDSLLFTAEGQRLEGTFVNTVGGWGSITGKRTASCASQSGEPSASRPRRRH